MKPIKIDNKIVISSHHPTFIIAEAGVNHNGDISLAKKLVEKAKRAGSNCVKFQTFKAEQVVTHSAPKANYQLVTTDPEESQLEMLQKLELPREAYQNLITLCDKLGILFLSTPYNIEDIDFLDNLGVKAFKVASGQAVEFHFLEYMARKGKPIILSTGMCTLAEVDQAVRVIRNTGNDQIVVLQCTTNYPSAIEDCNLNAMATMKNAMNVLVGYSDHTTSLTASIAAVALGACVIERHFTLDKNMPGPDHSSSSDPKEFKQLVKQIREAEQCLGNGAKEPVEIEKKNAIGMRRSLVAEHAVPAGEILSWENLTFKRPGTGITGPDAHLAIGKKAKKNILKDQMLSLEMVE